MGRGSTIGLVAAVCAGAAAAKAPEIISIMQQNSGYKTAESGSYKTVESRQALTVDSRQYEFRLSGPEEAEEGEKAEYTAQLETVGGLFDAWVLTGVDKKAGELYGEPELYAGTAVSRKWVPYKTAANRPFSLVVDKEFLDSVQAKIERATDINTSIGGFFESIGLPYPLKGKSDEVISKMPPKFLSSEVERSDLMEMNLISGGLGGYGSVKAVFKIKISGDGRVMASILANSSNIKPAALSGDVKIKVKKKKEAEKVKNKEKPPAPEKKIQETPSANTLLATYNGRIGNEKYTLEIYDDRAVLKIKKQSLFREAIGEMDTEADSLEAIDYGPDTLFDKLTVKIGGKPPEVSDLAEMIKEGGRAAMTAATVSVGFNVSIEKAIGRPLEDMIEEASGKKVGKKRR